MTLAEVNDLAVDMAFDRVGFDIAGIDRGTVAIVQNVVADALYDGKSDAWIAKRLNMILELGPRYTAAVDNFRDKLIADGVTTVRANRLADAYGNRLKKHRAMTVARHETRKVLMDAQREFWRSEQEEGKLSPWAVRVFTVHKDERLCKVCRPLNGKRRSLKDDIGGPPLHPSCRCWEVLVDQGIKKADIRVTDTEVIKHLPGLHNQRSHGRTKRVIRETVLETTFGKNLLKKLRSQGGFTVRAYTKADTSKGVAVAVKPTASFHKPIGRVRAVDIDAWIGQHVDDLSAPGARIGGWYDTTSGEVWLDVVRVFSDEDRAVEVGRRHNQIAVFSLTTGQEIPTGGTGRVTKAHRIVLHLFPRTATGVTILAALKSKAKKAQPGPTDVYVQQPVAVHRKRRKKRKKVDKGVRRVRTPAGSRRYNLPIGSPITRTRVLPGFPGQQKLRVGVPDLPYADADDEPIDTPYPRAGRRDRMSTVLRGSNDIGRVIGLLNNMDDQRTNATTTKDFEKNVRLARRRYDRSVDRGDRPSAAVRELMPIYTADEIEAMLLDRITLEPEVTRPRRTPGETVRAAASRRKKTISEVLKLNADRQKSIKDVQDKHKDKIAGSAFILTGEPEYYDPDAGKWVTDQFLRDQRDDLEPVLREAFTFEYAGLRTEVRDVRFGEFRTEVSGWIHDEEDQVVGTFTRLFEEGKVEHAFLQLSPQTQGNGFAEAFNTQAENYYVAAGINEIEVHADIDVGGYAWARKGFDFTPESRRAWHHRLQAYADTGDFNGQVIPDELIEEINGMLADPAFTALDVSELGKSLVTTDDPVLFPDSRDKGWWWFGKAVMLGSDWQGFKDLTPLHELAKAERKATRAQIMVAVGERHRRWVEDNADAPPMRPPKPKKPKKTDYPNEHLIVDHDGPDLSDLIELLHKMPRKDGEDDVAKVRRVRTPDGARRFGQPIGSIITVDLPDLPGRGLRTRERTSRGGAKTRRLDTGLDRLPQDDDHASASEVLKARRTAAGKARKLSEPKREDAKKNLRQIRQSKRPGGDFRGGTPQRRRSRENIFTEYGGGRRGYVPCIYCGLKLDADGTNHEQLEREKITTPPYGGVYQQPNLAPSCRGCNVGRGNAVFPYAKPFWYDRWTPVVAELNAELDAEGVSWRRKENQSAFG